MSPVIDYDLCMNKTLYYVHDPMCSWCWGFRPVWKEICKNLPENIEIKYILGGLAPDSDDPMSEEMKLEIAGYWRKVQKHIPDTEFNFDFWTKCIPKRSTYPACRAVIATKEQNPSLEKEIISAIQASYYLQAKNPSENEVLIAIAVSLGLDENRFIEDLSSAKTQKKLDEDIVFSRQIGAQGFPSMILGDEAGYQYVPLNYNDARSSLEFIVAS